MRKLLNDKDERIKAIDNEIKVTASCLETRVTGRTVRIDLDANHVC